MLDMSYIREHAAEVKKNIQDRRMEVDVDALLKADEKRLDQLQVVEALRQERNAVAEEMKTAKGDARTSLIAKGKALKERLAGEEAKLGEAGAAWNELLLRIPNRLHPAAPMGGSDAENLEIKRVGEPAKLSFKPLSHVDLAAKHDLIDFERGARVAGAKFYFLKGKLVLLEQALIQWVMREMVAEGFIPLITPDVAKDEVLLGVGFSPRGPETQVYSLEGTDLSLIGTAEIPVGGYHRDEILEDTKLPLKYVALSHCFRTEAGTYGRESYGLYRVHQFTKVELFVVSAPEQSDALHEELRAIEERIFTKLGVPFRVVDICTADLGAPAYRKYDLEAWMWGRKNGEGDWGEVTSTSNCTDYQARRLNIRTRRSDGSLAYAHTLNGTAVATSRALIALMENYQQEDGSILVPEVLKPFCGFDRIG